MFKKFTNGCVNLVQRFLPDAFIFCILLTIIIFIIAMPVAGLNPIEMANAWGNGVWSLLMFSMQMALVLVLGNAFANAPAIKQIIRCIAGVPKTAAQGIAFVTVVSSLCCWLNWGFGLVVGAILAREVAKKIPRIDYRLLIASAYSGFLVWHAGVSGSIPLTLASYDDSVNAATAGAVTAVVPTATTIFAPWNLIMVALVIVVITILNVKMIPADKDIVTIDARLLVDHEETYPAPVTPAEHMENSKILSGIIALLGIVYLIYYFVSTGSLNLSLNLVNLIFLILGIIFHRTPISYVRAITEAAKSAGGILLQFPFYAGIMGMMTAKGANGICLAEAISNVFVAVSTARTFPVFTFLSAGIVNFFVPSGGGQWAVQAPIVMPAGLALGVSPAVSGMAIAWGDAWTNMIQPFWALPALGIAGLGARDIMGYCVVALIVSGIIICGSFLFLVPLLA